MPRRLLPKSSTPRVKLRMARELAGWSQIELSHHLKTSQVTVSRWETGDTVPSPYFRKKLCLLFGKTLEELDLEPEHLSHEEEMIIDPVIAPPPRVPLVGRSRELASLRAHLCTEQEYITVAIRGLPGVGKTTLACTLAHDPQIRSCFPDGVLWAGLGVRPDVQHHLLRWGTLLGLSMTEQHLMKGGNREKELVLTIRGAIGMRRMLLILDDAWTMEDALALHQVGGAECAMLITTRFPHIATSLDDDPLILCELTSHQSFDLLRLLAPQIVERERQKVQTLVQTVGGLPLALTLIGNYLRLQGTSGQTRRVQSALDHLQSLETRFYLSEPRTHIDQHPCLPDEQSLSLHAVIAVTDQQLPAATRAAFYALAVFPAKPESFSEEAALMVAACSPETLDALLDMGLLEATADKRYSMHQTIADYARLHLDHQQPQERFIAYALTLLEQYQFDDEALAQDHCLLLQALEVAHLLGKQQELVRGVCAFIPSLLRRGNYSQVHLHLIRAQQAAQALHDPIGIGNILLHLGDLAGRQGDYAHSQILLQQGVTYARRQDDSEQLCALLSLLGRSLWKQGNYALATASLQEGLVLARQRGQARQICELLDMLGAVAERTGDYTLAEGYFREGLTRAREIGDKSKICRLACGLGIIFALREESAGAEALLREGLAIARQIGYHEQVCVLLVNLGELVRVVHRDFVQAGALLLEGLTLARKVSLREWQCAILINLIELEVEQENHQQARIYLEEGLLEAAPLEVSRISVLLFFFQGVLALIGGELEKGETAFLAMQQMVPAGDMELQAYLHYGQARLAAEKGHLQQAFLLGEASATALEDAGHYLSHEVRRWLDTLPPSTSDQENDGDRYAR